MSMLRSAFNTLTMVHSRPALLKRLGSPDIFSPIRITPSNYSRFLRGPEYTTISGVEFIIPIDSILGQMAQKITFSGVPASGAFKLKFGLSTTPDLMFDSTAADIQTQLRLLPGLANVLVTGSFLIGFTIIFAGFDVAPALGEVVDNFLLTNEPEAVDATIASSYSPWPNGIKKADRILEAGRLYAIDEIVEMHDLGGAVMGLRVRAE